MDIGIVTLYGNNNFGNKLQNYALQEYLKRIIPNCNVETIISYDDNFINLVKKYFKKSPLDIRTKNFLEFNKYINYNYNRIGVNRPKFKKKYDFIIFGSDQIWNCDFEGKTKLYSGNFAKNIKKISFSASFGKSFIDHKYLQLYKKSLLNFKSLSVREDIGKKIIEQIVGRKDIEVLIDPTMLLSTEDWDKLLKKPKMLKKNKYILNYFLGEISEQRKKEIERVAKENDCEIINILDKNSPFYECGPSEFLYLEKNAFLICTDSFHSSVFAILYNRPFVIFDREQKNVTSMNSRLDTLINKFKLKNRKFEGKITEKNLKHNYEEAYKILEKERQKSERFLKEALDIKE